MISLNIQLTVQNLVKISLTAGFEACLLLHCRHMDRSYQECNSCYLSFHSTSSNLDDCNRVVYVVSLFDQDEVCVSKSFILFYFIFLPWHYFMESGQALVYILVGNQW